MLLRSLDLLPFYAEALAIVNMQFHLGVDMLNNLGSLEWRKQPESEIDLTCFFIHTLSRT